jgi:hypothetical protein
MDSPIESPMPVAEPGPRVARTFLFELTGYIGIALAIAGIFVVLGASRPSLRTIAWAAIAITLGLLVAGFLAGRATNDAFHRMRSVMWFDATVAWTGSVALFCGGQGLNLSGKSYPLVVAIAVSVLAVPLWLIERRSLQAIAAVAAVAAGLLVLGFFQHVETVSGSDSIFGPTTFDRNVSNFTPDAFIALCYGAALALLGWRGVLRPKRTMMVLGSIAFIYGMSFVGYRSSGDQWLVGVLAVAASAVVLIFGELADVLAVRGIGIFGLLSNTTEVVAGRVHARTGGWIVAVVGLALVVVTVFLATKSFPSLTVPPPPPVPPMMDPPLTGGGGEPEG